MTKIHQKHFSAKFSGEQPRADCEIEQQPKTQKNHQKIQQQPVPSPPPFMIFFVLQVFQSIPDERR